VQFIVAPALYLFIRKSLFPKHPSKTWLHLLPFMIILVYFGLYYLQEDPVKYNLRITENNLDLEKIPYNPEIQFDPLNIHEKFHYLVFAQLLVYALLIALIVVQKYKQESIGFFTIEHSYLTRYRNLLIYYILALFIMCWLVFSYFQLGDYVFSIYLTGIVYLVGFSISFRSLQETYLSRRSAKYASSTLNENEKLVLADSIRKVCEDVLFYCSDSASLDELANKLHESKHHVSQVLNEKMGKSFFAYLADLRITRAKTLLSDPEYQKVTIDEISFMVGYNSRSAFNRVFKSETGQTPAEFRRNQS